MILVLFLSLRYCQWLAFSGRLRAGPSPLRSAIARRRRRHSPRRAARSSPLRHSGPVGPAPIPRSLSSTTGALAASAPRRFALRDPRARPAPPDPFPSTYASIYVRACRSGRRYVRRRSAVFTSRGDVRSLPVTTSHQWGDVVPSRRAVCSPRPTRRSTCARAGRAAATSAERGDVRSLPVTTSHQWGDVVPSRRAVCSPRPTRRSTCVRAGWAAATLADARRCPPQGGTRALSPSHPPLIGGDGGGRGPLLGSTVPARR